ncbi:MAG: hypothetical protein JNK21_01980 [Rhodospirillaceae bacterium]|nr:hypothetical protein [Rhodospirillaceae bacterium]
MLAQYFRIILFILALIAGVVLFAFAFTTAAIVVGVAIILGLIFGRGKTGTIWVVRRGSTNPFDQSQPPRHGGSARGPITIDHDPNDLPPPAGGENR